GLDQCETQRAALGRKPDASKGNGPARKGGVQARTGRGDTEAVRADQPTAVGAYELEQKPLALDALLADLREAGRDHAEGADAAREAGPGGVEHLGAGEAEHREVDLVGDLVHAAIAAHAGDGLAAPVDGVGDAGEVGREDVAEELA